MNYNKILDAVLRLVDPDIRRDFEQDLPRQILKRHGARTVCDVACGWGYHLEELGDDFDIVGLDIDPIVVDHAKCLMGHQAFVADWLDRGSLCSRETHDALLCLGNSLPLLQNRDQLEQALMNWKELLNPSGIVLIEIRAFASIRLALEGEYPLEDANIPWIAPDKMIATHVPEHDRVRLSYQLDGLAPFELEYLMLTPDELERALNKASYHIIERYEDFGASRANKPTRSHLVVARRS